MEKEDLISIFEMRMRNFDIEKYIENNEIPGLTEDDIDHLSTGIKKLIDVYRGEESPGHFLSAVIRNDFRGAVTLADNTNIKALRLYALFIYNYIPSDLVNMVQHEYAAVNE